MDIEKCTVFKLSDGILVKEEFEIKEIDSIYNYEKISLFKNFDTMSFIETITNYQKLLNDGTIKAF